MPGSSRTRSQPANLNRLSGDPKVTLDRKTQQLVFFRGTVHSIAKSLRKSEEAQKEEYVGRLVQLHMKKGRKRKKTLKCLEDRLYFEKSRLFSKSPVTKWITYSEIDHYFIFPKYPTVFMVSVNSTKPGHSLFQTFACQTARETNLICELVCRACRDPYKKLTTDTNLVRPYSTLSEGELQNKSVSQASIRNSVDSLTDGQSVELNEDEMLRTQTSHDGEKLEEVFEQNHVLQNAREPSPTRVWPMQNGITSREQSPIPRADTPVKVQIVHTTFTSAPVKSVYGEDECDSDKQEDDITYLIHDPKLGVVMNDDGPIYMYLRRFPCIADYRTEVDCFT